MLSYYLTCRKNTESKNPKILRTNNGRKMLLSKCLVCDSKESKFLKGQKARELLSNWIVIKVLVLIDLPLINALFDK